MFYAVRNGRTPGIYATWNECEAQVKGYPHPAFRKFGSQEEAEDFIAAESNSQGSQSSQKNEKRKATPVPPVLSRSITSPGAIVSSPTGAMDALIEMKASVKQLQQQLGMITQTMAYLTNGLTTLETALNVNTVSNNSPSLNRSRSSILLNHTPPVKRNFCQDGGSSEEPPAKKALTDDWIDNNFSGMAFDDEEGVEVYTDGACLNNGKAGAIAGVGVFWGKNNGHNVSERLCGRATNNRAEIHAARLAIEQAKDRKIKNLILYTDSEFLINSITKWIKGWKKRGWILSTGKPVINKDDFVELEDALKGINVKWVHVRGHQGIPGNEAADRLANEGCKKAL